MTMPFSDPAASTPPAPVPPVVVPAAPDATSALKSVGAGSSGVQWVQAANDLWIPKSVVTTAGDLIVATGNGAVGRLAAGAAGTVLRGQGAGVAPAYVNDPDVPLAVVTTAGDLIVATGNGAVGRLAAGGLGTVLTGNGAGVAPSYQAAAASAVALISSQVLASAVASVTFSSIPGTFNHLRLTAVARSASAAGDFYTVQLNGDTAANYDLEGGNVAGPTAMSNLAQPSWKSTVGDLAFAGSPSANSAGLLQIDLPVYAGTTFRKIGQWTSGVNDAGSIDAVVALVAWRSSAAVTSVKLAPNTGSNFVVGSSFYLYGIT